MTAPSQFQQTLGKTFLALRNRNFRLFFIGQLISNTGNWLTNVALVLLVLRITNSGLAVGILTALQYGPILFLSAWAGAVSDRLDRWKLLVWSQSLEMAQSAALAVLAFMPHPPLVGMYILAAAGGVLLAFDNPFRRSFVTEMVPRSDLPNAVVLYSTIVNISRIFGPTLAGLLAVTVGFGWCFTIDAASYVAVLVCLGLMRHSELYRQPAAGPAGVHIREGLRYIRATPSLWVSFVMLAAIGALSYNFNVTLPLFVTRSLHSTEIVFTILYSVFSFGAVVCALIVAHRGLVKLRHIVAGAAALGVAMLLLAAAPGVGYAVPAIFLVGMSSILYMTSTTAIIQVEAKPGLHGRLLALQTALMVGTTLIGGPLCGWLADVLGGRAPIIFGAVVALAAATWGYFASRGGGVKRVQREELVGREGFEPSTK